MKTEITSAIARSISQTEIVAVQVPDITSAIAEVSAQSDDCDWAKTDAGADVWGTDEESGSDFRLRLALA